MYIPLVYLLLSHAIPVKPSLHTHSPSSHVPLPLQTVLWCATVDDSKSLKADPLGQILILQSPPVQPWLHSQMLSGVHAPFLEHLLGQPIAKGLSDSKIDDEMKWMALITFYLVLWSSCHTSVKAKLLFQSTIIPIYSISNCQTVIKTPLRIHCSVSRDSRLRLKFTTLLIWHHSILFQAHVWQQANLVVFFKTIDSLTNNHDLSSPMWSDRT